MKTRYRFSHQAGGRYYWMSAAPVCGSLSESVSCPVDWFWNPTKEDLK